MIYSLHQWCIKLMQRQCHKAGFSKAINLLFHGLLQQKVIGGSFQQIGHPHTLWSEVHVTVQLKYKIVDYTNI